MCWCTPDTSSISRARRSSSSACWSSRRVRSRRSRACWSARPGAAREAPPERHQRAAVLAGLAQQLGHRRVRRSAARSARWLAEAGQSIVQILPINEMPPIETLAVLGDDGDGARSDLHRDGERRRLRRPRRRARARRRGAGGDQAAARSRRGSITPRSAGSRTVAAPRRSIASSRLEVVARHAARRALRRVRAGAIVVARRVRAVPSAAPSHQDDRAWMEWPEPLARADAVVAEARSVARAPR